jgi:hypothetical protein
MITRHYFDIGLFAQGAFDLILSCPEIEFFIRDDPVAVGTAIRKLLYNLLFQFHSQSCPARQVNKGLSS